MNLTKCANGHYYDADKYSSCPHCSKTNDTEDDVTINMEQAGATVPHTPSPAPAPATPVSDAGFGFMNIPVGIDEELPFN